MRFIPNNTEFKLQGTRIPTDCNIFPFYWFFVIIACVYFDNQCLLHFLNGKCSTQNRWMLWMLHENNISIGVSPLFLQIKSFFAFMNIFITFSAIKFANLFSIKLLFFSMKKEINFYLRGIQMTVIVHYLFVYCSGDW